MKHDTLSPEEQLRMGRTWVDMDRAEKMYDTALDNLGGHRLDLDDPIVNVYPVNLVGNGSVALRFKDHADMALSFNDDGTIVTFTTGVMDADSLARLIEYLQQVERTVRRHG